jgi:hypothetical protein
MNGIKILMDQVRGTIRIGFAGDDDNGIVRPESFLIVVSEILGRDFMEVGRSADGRVCIRMPLKEVGHHEGHEFFKWLFAITGFFFKDDWSFAVDIGLIQQGAGHAIGFEFECVKSGPVSALCWPASRRMILSRIPLGTLLVPL